jgi:hypothetical protein
MLFFECLIAASKEKTFASPIKERRWCFFKSFRTDLLTPDIISEVPRVGKRFYYTPKVVNACGINERDMAHS